VGAIEVVIGVDLAVASGLYIHKFRIGFTSAADLFGFHQCEKLPIGSI
jgi:hypothetical protein